MGLTVHLILFLYFTNEEANTKGCSARGCPQLLKDNSGPSPMAISRYSGLGLQS